jgi:hypothetical protein
MRRCVAELPPRIEIGDAPDHWAACWLFDADTVAADPPGSAAKVPTSAVAPTSPAPVPAPRVIPQPSAPADDAGGDPTDEPRR